MEVNIGNGYIVPFFGQLFLIILIAKIFGYINVGWFYVMLPITGPIFLFGLLIVGAIVYNKLSPKKKEIK